MVRKYNKKPSETLGRTYFAAVWPDVKEQLRREFPEAEGARDTTVRGSGNLAQVPLSVYRAVEAAIDAELAASADEALMWRTANQMLTHIGETGARRAAAATQRLADAAADAAEREMQAALAAAGGGEGQKDQEEGDGVAADGQPPMAAEDEAEAA